MGKYIDGFVTPVPKKNIEDYRKLAELAAKVWREHGALEYVECIADDVKPGEVTSFPRSVKLKGDKVVFFSNIVYESRAHRDQVLEKTMKDPRMPKYAKSLPFDAMRLYWGGFEEIVRA